MRWFITSLYGFYFINWFTTAQQVGNAHNKSSCVASVLEKPLFGLEIGELGLSLEWGGGGGGRGEMMDLIFR